MPAADPVIVVGGGLAGMAAAARLVKQRHPVELYEARGTLGGTWAPYEVAGLVVDDAPAVLTFPAPWRDLFRKSGRPLEAELDRAGSALVPAGPLQVTFADGGRLTLPTDRGAQYAVLDEAYGAMVAGRWRDLLDRLDEVWQALRPLGLEAELRDRRQLSRAVRRRLLAGRTVADLAEQVGHPHLAALLRSTAHRAGSVPERTPALVAVDWAVQRTFGRWQLSSGRSSVLVELLAARLALRRVSVHLGTAVTGVAVRDGRVAGVQTGDGFRPGRALVLTVDPWQAVADLVPRSVARRTRRGVRALRPARAPAVRHRRLAEPTTEVTETLTLDPAGVPTVTSRRPAGDGATWESVHDHRPPTGRAAYGVAWRGVRSWLRRPPVTTEVPGLFLAGPGSPGGSTPSAVVLSGALAAYGMHDFLEG